MNEFNYSTDVEYETKPKKKFQITRGMLILIIVILVILITGIVIIVKNVINKQKETYTLNDFNRLEQRMSEEAQVYVSQKNIVLTDLETKIDLSVLLEKNGGNIDPNKVKASKICSGYVIVSTNINYKSYIKCGNLYTTTGYVSNDITTTKEVKTTTQDKEKPTITLIGEDTMNININTKFVDPGVKAIDNIDGDITSKVIKEGRVDTSKTGTYVIIYKVQDRAKNEATIKRTINVINVRTTTKEVATTRQHKTTKKTVVTTRRVTTPPTIILRGQNPITIILGSNYNDPGYYATDCFSNDITSRVRVSGNLDTSKEGRYYINYNVTDNYGNKAGKTRTVIVKRKTIELSGINVSPNAITLTRGQTYTLTVYFTPNDATNKSVTWSSDDPVVATVSNGVITARQRGRAIIKVTAYNGKYSSTIVTVK